MTTTLISLGAILLALAGWIGMELRKSGYRPAQAVVYFVNVLLTRILWRVRIEGRFPVSPDQGAVVICNHRSSVDPFFIQLMPGRVVHWFVAKEYFSVPLVGPFLRISESIPTSRAGVDTAATKMAIRYAVDGQLVGMLPEGRINETQKLLLPGRPGAALVAIKARVPVVPCYLHDAPYTGTFWGCLFRPARVRLVIGRPVDLSEYFDRGTSNEVLREVTCRLLKEIASLAGHDDFQPELAGRRWKPDHSARNGRHGRRLPARSFARGR